MSQHKSRKSTIALAVLGAITAMASQSVFAHSSIPQDCQDAAKLANLPLSNAVFVNPTTHTYVGTSPAGELIIGTKTADVITGTSGNDVICGRGGPDTIKGLGGSDIIFGGNGADDVDGGDGNDNISGGNDNDKSSCHPLQRAQFFKEIRQDKSGNQAK